MVKHEEAIEALAAERYVLGELQPQQREEFEEHYFGCVECARDVEALDLLVRGSEQFGEKLATVRPGWRERMIQWWGRPQMAFASACAMFVLLSVSVYQAWELRQRGPVEGAAEVIAGYMLRPESRGETTTIAALQGSGHVLLEVDLPGAAGKLRWSLRADENAPVLLRGESEAPALGATWKLLLPAGVLQGNTRYLLEINGLVGGQSYQFRFTVRKN